jgi:ATP-dependent Clp protease ATP-binding subunit ClpA
MSMKAFKQYVASILEQAGQQAHLEGSATIEAQHVLLAMAAQPQSTAGQVLSSVGLDAGTLREALDRELEHSLSAAGVSAAAFGLPRAERAVKKEPGRASPRATALGVSVRHALERGVTGVRGNPQPAHLLLGILQAQVGTVPRMLQLAGVERAQLKRRVQQSLEAAG